MKHSKSSQSKLTSNDAKKAVSTESRGRPQERRREIFIVHPTMAIALFDPFNYPILKDVRDFAISLESSYDPIPVLDIVHAAAVVVAHRQIGGARSPWPQALCAVIFAALGGTLLTNMLLGQPPSWIYADFVLPTYILFFFIERYSPGDVVHQILVWPPLKWIIGLLDNISWATAISAWGVKKALTAGHPEARHSMVAAIVCGFLSGCGGGLIHSAFSLTSKQWRFSTPAGIATSVPAFAVRAAATLSFFYYMTTNPHAYLPWPPLLTPNDARFTLVLIIVTLDSIALPGSWRRYVQLAALKPNIEIPASPREKMKQK